MYIIIIFFYTVCFYDRRWIHSIYLLLYQRTVRECYVSSSPHTSSTYINMDIHLENRHTYTHTHTSRCAIYYLQTSKTSGGGDIKQRMGKTKTVIVFFCCCVYSRVKINSTVSKGRLVEYSSPVGGDSVE